MKKIIFQTSYKGIQWECECINIRKYTDYMQCRFKGRGSSIDVYISIKEEDRWIFFPTQEKGCTISRYDDYFWNHEKLTDLLESYIDSATVAKELDYIKGLLNSND